MFEPLRITAHLHGSVAFNRHEGLSLDGPLLYHVVRLRLGEAFFSARPSNAQLATETSTPDPDMPLMIHEAGGTWCYCMSSAEIHGDHGTEMHHWNLRFDDALAGDLLDKEALKIRGKVNLGSGPYKAYHQPLFGEVVERLVWYAVGDAERIRELLSHVRALGKKRQSGDGTVMRWEVEPWDGSPERWLWRAPGVLARPVPLQMLPDWRGDLAYMAYRPPCWLPVHQTMCAIPSVLSEVAHG